MSSLPSRMEMKIHSLELHGLEVPQWALSHPDQKRKLSGLNQRPGEPLPHTVLHTKFDLRITIRVGIRLIDQSTTDQPAERLPTIRVGIRLIDQSTTDQPAERLPTIRVCIRLIDQSTTDQPAERLLSITIKLKVADHAISLGANSIPQTVVEGPSVGLNDSSLTLKSSSTKQPPVKLDELNFDCLEKIEKHLDGCSSLALAQVNPQLRIALSKMNLSGGRLPPYLILSESSHSETCRLLRLHRQRNKIVTFPSPAASGKRVWGSPHGWIVTMDPKLQLHFLNISSQDQQEPLPPLPMTDNIARLDWFLMVQKCLVFKIFPPEFLVMIILHPANVLYFTKPGKLRRWVLVSNLENYVFRDVALHQGQVYLLCDHGSIVKINFNESDLAETSTTLVVSDMEDETAERSYLVASPDHLYGVFRYDDEDDGRTTFVVKKLNFGSLQWEVVGSIGNHAFFVGRGNSLCFSPMSSDNYSRNCIYFSNEDSLILPNEGRFDFGIYDLDTWCTDLKRVRGEGVPLPHSCPTWIAYDLTPPNFRN